MLFIGGRVAWDCCTWNVLIGTFNNTAIQNNTTNSTQHNYLVKLVCWVRGGELVEKTDQVVSTQIAKTRAKPQLIT